MGRVARELEEQGIAAVCVMLLEEVAEKVKPPRGLLVPFGWGQPLGPPGEAETHESVTRAALSLLERTGDAPILKRWEPTAT